MRTKKSKEIESKLLEIGFNVLRLMYYEKKMSYEDIGKAIGVSTYSIFHFMKKNGIVSRDCRCSLKNRFGELNACWKGDDARYDAFHARVKKIRGKPNRCDICDTTKAKRFEWASLTKNYKDPYDYVRVCTSCHRKMDWEDRDQRYRFKKKELLK